MKTIKSTRLLIVTFLTLLIAITGCNDKIPEESAEPEQANISSFEKEIAHRLREFENNLKNGDSIALGQMYTEDAVIMPTTVGRDAIVKNFGSMIRDSITGSSFATTNLWGNEKLLVEEGKGTWYYSSGEVVGRGTYLVVWVEEDGNWKILRDIWFPVKKN